MHSVLSSTSLVLSVLATAVFASPQYGDSNSDSASSTATASSSTSSSSASGVHSVQVGPGLSFSPDTVAAAQGDWIEFTFGSGHSVAQSTFDKPCVPISSGAGVYSGFPDDGDVWRIMVNSTDPLWLYCSAQGHCEGGMALVVNPPNNDKTLDAYKSAAKDAQGSSPSTVQGGVFGAASESSSSSASGSASGSASSTGSSASAATSGNSADTITVKNGLLLAGAVAAGVAAVL
ncbi:hypothetical protein A1O1_07181 [Capronia coronata CBS 617.96]|uniref:Phytocyanin domain-containing protein n=1 Tax=Capronia coronata CBS 617.96 TaxID=1182541 RepID=W9XTK2_9EURO|nr:uncharacterized protein A1O1_07181 [Capronia coronata CBS 617.96]EXJ83558.1 hypothetical protein A1O1_07181 [Capronia coronata CBS 617.96]